MQAARLKWVFIVFIFFSHSVEASRENPESTEPKNPISVPSSSTVFVATYEGVINPVAAEYFSHSINEAVEHQAEALIIQLDTPGGLDTSMRLIIKDIIRSEIPVVIYVSPSGGRAASAGVFIAYASHIAAMAPGTNIGAAHPVSMGGGEMDDETKKKVENDAAAYIRSLAVKRGRNVSWGENAVRQSVSATEMEALELGVIDLVVDDLPSLLMAIHGRTIALPQGDTVLNTKNAVLEFRPMTLRLKILKTITNPNIAYILMMLGTTGLLLELYNPGSIFPGVVGAISLILSFYAFQNLPVNYAGLLLILLGVILFIIEINVPSFGLLTIGGAISLALGSLMLIKSDAPYMQISYMVIFPAVLMTTIFFGIVMGTAWKTLRNKPMTGMDGMTGLVGVARTDISPRGQVMLQGELWEADSAETIHEGDSIEVTGIEGLKLHVKGHPIKT